MRVIRCGNATAGFHSLICRTRIGVVATSENVALASGMVLGVVRSHNHVE